MDVRDTSGANAGPDPAVVDAIEARIGASPGDGVCVTEYLEALTPSLGAEAALERLAAIQDRAGTPLPAVLLRLEQTWKNERVRDRFEPMFAEAASEPFFVACAELWRAHFERRPLDREACRLVASQPKRSAVVYFSYMAAPLTQISAVRQNPKQRKALEEAGIDIDRFQAGIDEFIRFGSPEWEAVLAKAAHSSEAYAAEATEKERFSSSKDKMVAERRLRFVDPFTGERIEPFDGLVHNGKAVYGFAGREVFYLIYAYLGVDPCGVYIPARDLVLSLSPQLRGALMGEQIANIRVALLDRIARSPDAFETAVAGRLDGRMREVVLVVGRTENFAHHLWNYYAAIERLTLTGAERNVDVLLTCGTQFFGPIPELFPELAGAAYEHDAADYNDPRPFRTDSLVVPTGSIYVPASLSRRVIETMRARPREAHFLDPHEVPLEGPVVWFGMRLDDKSWVDQENGIPLVMARIVERYPDAVFLLDGFSFPVGVDRISEKWAGVIAELNRIAGVVRAASPDPERVLNLVGNTLRENVLWADATDVYLAPLGSTQHKVGWFTDAPGLVYAPPMYGEGRAERTVGNWAIEISAPIEWLIGKPVGPGKRRGASATRTRMQNVELDPDHLADRMLAMLARRFEERGGWRASERVSAASQT